MTMKPHTMPSKAVYIAWLRILALISASVLEVTTTVLVELESVLEVRTEFMLSEEIGKIAEPPCRNMAIHIWKIKHQGIMLRTI
jgi:hypothetical protein